MLRFECECGERHAEPSSDNIEVCDACVTIRKRVENLDPEFLRLREFEIAREDLIAGMLDGDTIAEYDLAEYDF